MSSSKKSIKDIELDLLRTVRVDLTPETYEVIAELAKLKLTVSEIQPREKCITLQEAIRRAKFWFSSGSAPPSTVLELKKKAFFRSKEGVDRLCVEAFLVSHPTIKLVERGRGRPPGMSPEAKKRLAFGLVISDLVNLRPPRYAKKLKAA